jgi:hypothetical protein
LDADPPAQGVNIAGRFTLTRLVALEPQQADLLKRIVEGPLIDSDALSASGSLSEASAEEAEGAGDDVDSTEAE